MTPIDDGVRDQGRTLDISRLLGLTGPGAWVLAGLYCLTYLTIASLSGGEPLQTWQGRLSLALILATAILLVVPFRSRFPLPLPLVAWVLAVVAFSTIAMSWQLSPYGWPGWVSWNFGADTFLLFMVALRGRVWWGLVGMLLMSAITIVWTWTEAGDWWHGFDLSYRQVASYLAGAFFAMWLRRTARQIVEFQNTEGRRIAAEQASAAAADERRRQLDRVRTVAGPALTAIAAGSVTDDQRREHGLLEAELRDQIRGRTLATGGLPSALRAARGRGIDVVLLDDVRDDSADPAFLAGAAEWAAARVAALTGGDATIRLALVDGEPVVTFAISTGSAQTFSR